MRLLDTEALTVVDISDDTILNYAILSHTWGPREVSFQDLEKLSLGSMSPARREKATSHPTFAKVVNTANLARQNGYKYVWIDTCCIDKTSSAELSEAINSMYRWYEQATVCYVYLADVTPLTSRNMPETKEATDEHTTVAQSRWFSRGWTLQELIAPKDVRFFAKDWSYIGSHKQDIAFRRLLSDVTGIDDRVLQGRLSPQDMSVSTRMKWAALRKTTRLEDAAYCLMGLFGVNMPLLYGEGKRAFVRLQEEILKETDDQSLFSWTTPEQDDQALDSLSGLLADSPFSFKDVGIVRPLPPILTRDSVPSSVTNQGLRIQLYLSPILGESSSSIDEEYHAILDCSYREGNREYCPTIFLRRLWGDQFARVRSHKCISLLPPVDDYSKGQKGYKVVYVKQRPVYVIPDITLPMEDSQWQTVNEETRYRLLGVYPPDRWDSDSMSLKSIPSQLNRVTGVFRFGHPWIPNRVVDIAVGLNRESQRGWDSWCIQQRCQQEDSLENVFHTLDQRFKLTENLTLLRRELSDHGQLLDSLAQVTQIQTHGRSYIILSVLSKAEMQTQKELLSIPAAILDLDSGDVSINIQDEICTLTRACSVEDTVNLSIFPSGEATESVRTNPNSVQFKALISAFLPDQLVQNQNRGKEFGKDFDLINACKDGDYRQVERSLKRKASAELATSSFYEFHPIHWATIGGHLAIVQLLLKNHVSESQHAFQAITPIHIAAMMGNVEIMEYFLEEALKTRTALEVESLLQARTSLTLETPFHLAAAYAPPESVEEILKIMCTLSTFEGVLPSLRCTNYLDETPLHRAAAMNNVKAAKYILEQRSPFLNFLVTDKFGRTPLWHAASASSSEMIQLLSADEAVLNLADDFGRAPIHVACREGNDNAVGTLLGLGVNPICETSPLGLTPCDYAALFGHVACLTWMIMYNVDLNAHLTRSEHFLPIHLAAANGHLACVKLLCANGSKHKMPSTHYIILDEAGTGILIAKATQTAEEIAQLQGHHEIVEYFKSLDEQNDRRPPSGADLPRRRIELYEGVTDLGTLRGDPGDAGYGY